MATEGSMLDTLVVGAGPAGIGCALALDAVDGLTYGVVDRAAIGQSFLDWSPEQRLLTPSFTTNGYGETDLNAVHPATSPAYALDTDYLSGAQYARYLRGVATGFNLPILENTEVRAIHRRDTGFSVDTGRGTVPCRTIIWAGGEYHDRSLPGIPGARLLEHSSLPLAWAPHDGPVVIIGGYESGIDLACHHIADGADVVVVNGSAPLGRRERGRSVATPRPPHRRATAGSPGHREVDTHRGVGAGGVRGPGRRVRRPP